MADSDVLRQHLGERIPAGGTDADTFFSDAEIAQLLADNDDILSAAAQGWLMKASEFAGLVNTSEGGNRTDMSDLHKHAMAMAEHYSTLTAGGASSRGVVIHELVRD